VAIGFAMQSITSNFVPVKSELREAVCWGLREAGMTIAFPQLDVHFDAPVLDALDRTQRIA
jgi:small-conductance mechanosensitive channel